MRQFKAKSGHINGVDGLSLNKLCIRTPHTIRSSFSLFHLMQGKGSSLIFFDSVRSSLRNFV